MGKIKKRSSNSLSAQYIRDGIETGKRLSAKEWANELWGEVNPRTLSRVYNALRFLRNNEGFPAHAPESGGAIVDTSQNLDDFYAVEDRKEQKILREIKNIDTLVKSCQALLTGDEKKRISGRLKNIIFKLNKSEDEMLKLQ